MKLARGSPFIYLYIYIEHLIGHRSTKKMCEVTWAEKVPAASMG